MPFPQRVRILFSSLSPSKFGDEISCFADPGCLTLDPGSWIWVFSILDPGSWIQIFLSWIPDPRSELFPSRILDPGCTSKNLSILTKKNGFSALKNMIRDFHPGSGSRIWILTFFLSQIPILDPRLRIQGSKRNRIPDPGSWIQIRNTGDFWFAQVVGGSIGYWLLTGAAVLTTHLMDQVLEAFMCKKEFSVSFVLTLSLQFIPFWSYDALRICFLTHLVCLIFVHCAICEKIKKSVNSSLFFNCAK